ncbi:uncharacterized protein LOC134395995 [Elgaria multicarinata webbii]|uniref:uncharacterized protein LOC134395995 n=1 Tax=Elgaria multicarinata webbii TaxID=159646 RepID=UPI002FCD2E85
MASVREVSSIAEELLCPICLSIFQDPRMLVCGHNFCLSCIESCVISKGQHQGTCPECRTPFSLQDVACNRVLANLSEKARLLKLEEGPPSSRYFCEEHEEPLKLFCSQDEAPICVICRDLPQHQGHSFLPFKNAVKTYQEKLKASQEPLEDGVKWATTTQFRQLKAIEELEGLSQHLCGCIFIAFEELRELLNEREQSMLGTVKQMKEDNLAEMEGRLEYLKAYESSHAETISSIQAALDETNEFAFLKGIKELMGRIQECRNKDNHGASKDPSEKSQGPQEGEEANEKWARGQRDQAAGDGGETYEEAEKDEDGAIVPVDPGLGVLEESLDFEAWKDMLRSIGIGETYDPDSLYCSSPLEEDVLQSEGSENSEEETGEVAEADLEDSAGAVEVGSSAPGKGSSGRRSSGSNATPTVGGPPYRPPLVFSRFPMPLYPRPSLFGKAPVQGWGMPCKWTPQSQWVRRGTWQGRGILQRPPFFFRRGQGWGYPRNPQMFQPSYSSASHPEGWRTLRKEPPKPGEAHVTQGGSISSKQRAPGESGAGAERKEPPGKGRGGAHKQRPQSGGGYNLSQSGAASTKKEPPRPREAHAAGPGASGEGQGPAQRPPTPHRGGDASAGSKGAQNKHRGGRGRGQGSGSAKGPRNK